MRTMKLFRVLLYCAFTTTVTYTNFKIFPAQKGLKRIIALIMVQFYISSAMGQPSSPMQALWLKQQYDKNFNQNAVPLYYYPGTGNLCLENVSDLSHDSSSGQRNTSPDTTECHQPSRQSDTKAWCQCIFKPSAACSR